MKTTILLLLVALVSLPFADSNRIRVEAQTVAPAYQAGFNPQEDLLKQILQELRAMRSEKAGATQSFPQLLAQKCASCHTEGKEDRGGDFILLSKKGEIALSVNDLRKVKQKVISGQMPPASPLGEGEKKVFADYYPNKESP